MLVSAAAPGTGDVRVEVTMLRSAKGMVLACMTREREHFPDCQGDAAAYALKVPAGATVTLDFGAVPAGRYAISVLHDENGNGQIDRALGLMPKEGYGFSRDAPVRFGPPSFKRAAFDVGDVAVRQTIRMRYMF
jgi:uncharacterized protein (DUF2141 family)